MLGMLRDMDVTSSKLSEKLTFAAYSKDGGSEFVTETPSSFFIHDVQYTFFEGYEV